MKTAFGRKCNSFGTGCSPPQYHRDGTDSRLREGYNTG